MRRRSRSTREMPGDVDAFAADRGPGAARGATGSPHPRTVLPAVFAGGVVGTVARAGLTEGWAHGPAAWPWATFTANLVGAFALGVVVAVLRGRPDASGLWRPLLGTGLCGGLTTFSTLQWELVRMVDARAWALAVAYLTVSLLLGLLAVAAGLRWGARRTDPSGSSGSPVRAGGGR